MTDLPDYDFKLTAYEEGFITGLLLQIWKGDKRFQTAQAILEKLGAQTVTQFGQQ